MATKNRFQFEFVFDKDYIGHKSYDGTLTQCVKQFNNDQRTHVLPNVKSVRKVIQVG